MSAVTDRTRPPATEGRRNAVAERRVPGRGWMDRIPTAGWVCALVALLNAFAWSLIVPLFQVPDEPAHVAYAQYVAETGRPPTGAGSGTHFSREERLLLYAMHRKEVSHRPDNRPLAGPRAHRRVERVVDAPLGRTSDGGYTSVVNNPPLYYGGEAVLYRLSPSSALPDRIHLMRLLSGVLAAVTVLFIYLFLRELLPATPWAWAVGALAVALQPMVGFIAGGVNSDNLLFAASAGLFLAFALSFRRGLTTRRGVAIGAAAAVGLLAKINMLGLLPGIALGLLLLVWRAAPANRQATVRAALAAAGVAAAPVLLYMLLNSTVWDRGLFFGSGGVQGFGAVEVASPGGDGSGGGGGAHTESATLGGAFSYLWQFYLPRLPSMEPRFDAYQLREVWFDGFVGRFGWLDYGFGGWVYDVAIPFALAILALALRELVARWEALRRRLPEVATYAALGFGLLVLIAVASYIGRLTNPGGFEQVRYLFPLLPVYAALIALAVRGAGRRFGPLVGIAIVSLAIAHTVAAMLLTLSRYYG